MNWALDKCRQFFAIIGYPYPPVYKLIAELGLVAFILTAAVQRIVSGLSGWDWLLVVVAVSLGIWPLIVGFVVVKPPLMVFFPVFIIGCVVLFWTMPVEADSSPMILVVAVTMQVAIVSPRQGLGYLAAFAGAAVAGALFHTTDQGWLFVFMVLFGAAVGQLMRVQLKASQAAQREREQQIIVDRAGIAGEVHDVVAHSLSIVLLNVTAARRALEPGDDGLVDPADVDDARDALRDAEQQGRAAMDDVRRTVALLRSDQNATTPQPGFDDIDDLIAGFRRAGSIVVPDIRRPAQALGRTTELAVYRVIQESLTNASKHAAGAPVSVTAKTADGRYTVRICNPADPSARTQSGGLGLSGMADRVRNADGTLRAEFIDRTWCVVAEFGAA